MKATTPIYGRQFIVTILDTPEDVAKALAACDSTRPPDEQSDGGYFYNARRNRHLVWFARETLTEGVVIHEATHIALRNMRSPSGDFEEDLALGVEEAADALLQLLRFHGVLSR